MEQSLEDFIRELLKKHPEGLNISEITKAARIDGRPEDHDQVAAAIKLMYYELSEWHQAVRYSLKKKKD